MEPVKAARFADMEEEVAALWERIGAFRESQRRNADKPAFKFFDGPPFATGLPHYGHILAGTIKDVVTRYQHQTGHSVERRFGWDCHGLPVEYEIDKKLDLKGREDVLKMGIEKYNAECRSIVMRYSSDWRSIVTRLGRWIDFDNDYKTLNKDYMESVWWVFSQIFEKHVYRGFKVLPFSTACGTPLSNFEAKLAYQDVVDPAVTVTFPVCGHHTDAAAAAAEKHKGASLVAWTTTPWTLPSNLALVVHPNFDYVKVKDDESGELYILLKALLPKFYPQTKKMKAKGLVGYTIVDEFKGETLRDITYTPLFDFFVSRFGSSAFRVLCDTYVTADSGTGVVHSAPAFGEDDYRVCVAADVVTKGGDIPCPVDDGGKFTDEVKDWAGVHVKESDKAIIIALKTRKRLVRNDKVTHSYPFCWRSDTPLIYKAVPSWFIKVEDVRERLVKHNLSTHWVPQVISEKRFHSWLENARDWCVSRNRFWGAPIPVWTNDDGSETVCVGSVAELERLSGVTGIQDLHRETVDKITIPAPSGNGVLHRIDEVFDCWFESGCMPYGQVHYPFENKAEFDAKFPADFIAEGLDQTRGWFYTLLVLSTLLFDRPPFQHVIVNGMVLAEDGKKMSKRLKNYPDPMAVAREHGADALRLYLINSPAVRAEPLLFNETGVRGVVRDVIMPWFNAYKFLVQYASEYGKRTGAAFAPLSETDVVAHGNGMDAWIFATQQELISAVRVEMDKFRLYTVAPHLVRFVDMLTNWYVRANRPRLKGNGGGGDDDDDDGDDENDDGGAAAAGGGGGDGDERDCHVALSTLFHVLLTMCKVVSPFMPFIAEGVYQNLRRVITDGEESVHYLPYPDVNPKLSNARLVRVFGHMKTVVELGRRVRIAREVALRMPLKKITVAHCDQQVLDDVKELEHYVRLEMNVEKVELTTDVGKYMTTKATLVGSTGRRLKADMSAVKDEVMAMTAADVAKFDKDGEWKVMGGKYTLSKDEILVTHDFSGGAGVGTGHDDRSDILVVVDLSIGEAQRHAGAVRELTSMVQRARKLAGLTIADYVEAYYTVDNDALSLAVAAARRDVERVVRATLLPDAQRPEHAFVMMTKSASIDNNNVKAEVKVTRPALAFDEAALAAAVGGDAAAAAAAAARVRAHMVTLDYKTVVAQLQRDGKRDVCVGAAAGAGAAATVTVVLGTHVFLNTAAMLDAKATATTTTTTTTTTAAAAAAKA